MKIDMALLRASRRSWLDVSVPRVGPYWLRWVWMLLFSATLALGFAILGFFTFVGSAGITALGPLDWLQWYGRNFIVSLSIGSLIQLGFDTVGHLVGGRHRVLTWPAWLRTIYFSGIPLLCTAIGWPLGQWLAGGSVGVWFSGDGYTVIVGCALFALLLTFLFHQFFAMKARQLVAERRAAEAQLRLLQGQIEPHFLFNTLAGVQSLIDTEPAKAKQMLGDFTDYLRASLGTLRSDRNPLQHELDLAEHYLRLLGARMEDRLHWHIEADVAARSVPVPPLLLQPLVENAIHHGLEPQLAGGTVHVNAHVEGPQLVLEVRDDGRGLAAPPRPGARKGHGMALQNIRERLLSHYGPGASLELISAQPGTRAVIRLPIEPGAAVAAH